MVKLIEEGKMLLICWDKFSFRPMAPHLDVYGTGPDTGKEVRTSVCISSDVNMGGSSQFYLRSHF